MIYNFYSGSFDKTNTTTTVQLFLTCSEFGRERLHFPGNEHIAHVARNMFFNVIGTQNNITGLKIVNARYSLLFLKNIRRSNNNKSKLCI